MQLLLEVRQARSVSVVEEKTTLFRPVGGATSTLSLKVG